MDEKAPEPTLSNEAITEIKAKLGILIRNSLWDSWRILNVQIFDIGEPINQVNKHGQTIAHGEMSLRVSCPWRITWKGSIVAGCYDRSLPDDKSTRNDERWTLLDAKVERWIKGCADHPRIIESVEVDCFGGAVIYLSDSSCLEIFPSSCDGESWRMLYPDSGIERHIVVNGNRVEYS